MSDPLADFHARLFSIRPFTETLSPPSSARKERSQDEAGAVPAIAETEGGYDPFKELTPLRRVVSERREGQLGDSNYKTITSISSTIDMLFSKIEKIKEEFSYALDRPHSEMEIRHEEYLPHFHSEKVVEIVHENKENVYHKEEEKAGKDDPCLSVGRFILHSQSLPLQDHDENLVHRDYFSHPVNTKFLCEPIDLFPSFSPELLPYQSQPLKISDF
jgi:hypothetical protein